MLNFEVRSPLLELDCMILYYCHLITRRLLFDNNLLCPNGPLFFSILEAVLPKLSPIHWEYVWSVKIEDGVDVLLRKAFSRQDLFPRRPDHSFRVLLTLFLLKFVQDCYKG